jgi:hypothetical protein
LDLIHFSGKLKSCPDLFRLQTWEAHVDRFLLGTFSVQAPEGATGGVYERHATF